jgi:hypothetical protein
MAFRMRWPTEFGRINQPFGARPEFYGQFGLPGHEGIDFQAPTGTKIFAVADGVVKVVLLDGNQNPTKMPYGNQVRVEHRTPEGVFTSVYAHLEDVMVSPGQTVRAGQLIATADSTGNSTGSHLHLTLKRAGATASKATRYPSDIIDPTPFLDAFGTKYPDPPPVVITPPVITPPPTSVTPIIPTPTVQTLPTAPPLPPTPVRSAGQNELQIDAGVIVTVTPPTPIIPIPGTDGLRYLTDVTIPDNTVFPPGQTFVKTWRVQNNGTTSWGSAYTLVHIREDRLGGMERFPLPVAKPSETVNLSITLTAPTQPGVYRSVWRPQNAKGEFFGAVVFALIRVGDG